MQVKFTGSIWAPSMRHSAVVYGVWLCRTALASMLWRWMGACKQNAVCSTVPKPSTIVPYQQGVCNHFSFQLPGHKTLFLVNPEGFFWSELTASSLLVCDLDIPGGWTSAKLRPDRPAQLEIPLAFFPPVYFFSLDCARSRRTARRSDHLRVAIERSPLRQTANKDKEERRIAYVAMTRTQGDLFVCVSETCYERLATCRAAFVATLNA